MTTQVIEKNLHTLKKLIADYEQTYHREKNSVGLLAASKGQPIANIKAALLAGQSTFGENYLQEALKKMEALSDLSISQAIEWHFIGTIQHNKTRKIAEHFSWVQSVATMKTAKRLNDHRPLHLPPLNICIEVNVNDEETKSGAMMDEVIPLAHYCLTLPQLQLRGLMAIPAAHQNRMEQRQGFHKLYALWQSLRHLGFSLDTLSMGMSDDMEAAIAEGSTLVRIGTALFGGRD